MANGKLPLLGGAEVLDLQAHVKDKKMRELLTRLVDERNRAIDHVRLVSLSLLEASEVLAECRGHLREDCEGSADPATRGELIAKITELLGDGA